jgi:hypothetical protein
VDNPPDHPSEWGPDPAACYVPENATIYDAAHSVVAAQPGACTAEAVAEGLRACTGVTATGAACDAFKAENARCSGCLGFGIIQKDDAGNAIVPALVPLRGGGFSPNTAACTAVLLRNEATCGIAYVNEMTCIASCCDTCPADRTACEGRAADDACLGALVEPNGDCWNAYMAGLAAQSACKATSASDALAKVAAVLCQ